MVEPAAYTFHAADKMDVAASEDVGCATSDDLQISSFSLSWIVHRLDDEEFLHFYFWHIQHSLNHERIDYVAYDLNQS